MHRQLRMLRATLQRLTTLRGCIDALGLAVVVWFLLSYFPKDVLTATMPATGGDTGSHFWPLHTMFHHGLFDGQLRVWNPGNLAGEPHLVHYFPLPFILMGILGFIFPLHVAFNIGTMLCVLLLPLAVYVCLRAMATPRPTPLLAAAFSSIFLLTDTYSAWGGNLGSTLAGQFCHLYALVFLLFGMGLYCWEVRRGRMPLWSGVCFAGVALSHGYILLLLPVSALLLVLFLPERTWRVRLLCMLYSAGLSLALSCWWLLPMLDNNQWMTAYADQWLRNIKSHEYAPYSLYPLAIMALLLLPFDKFFTKSKTNLFRIFCQQLVIWVGLFLTSLLMVALLPKLGLVDVRAIPQAHLMLCIIAAILLGWFLTAYRAWIQYTISMLFLMLALIWASQHGQHYKEWAHWNYSSWNNKPLFEDVMLLSDFLRGDFDEPRVVYEHDHATNNRAGTPRVFENLPYFANRATLESLYMQASPISAQIYAAQAMVSLKPSCPFPNYPCPVRDLPNQIDHLKLLGVKDLILSSPEVREQAERSDRLTHVHQQGPWHVYQINDDVSLVDFFTNVPDFAPEKNWRQDAYKWFTSYHPEVRFRVLAKTMDKYDRQALDQALLGRDRSWVAPEDCQASVATSFSGLQLQTDCPGYAHLLKFSFNHAFVASTGDQPFFVYPGYIGLIPSQQHLALTYGGLASWRIYSWLSVIASLFYLIIWLFSPGWWSHPLGALGSIMTRKNRPSEKSPL